MTANRVCRCGVPAAGGAAPACVARMPAAAIAERMGAGFRALWVTGLSGACPPAFGRRGCDFCDGTLVPVGSPEALRGAAWRAAGGEGCLICFHPSLAAPADAAGMCGRTFFGYGADESLHMSRRETAAIEREAGAIADVLRHAADSRTYALLGERIALLLDCVSRFYERQFILRHDDNRALVRRADGLLEDMFRSGRVRCGELPSAAAFAAEFGCSAAYFDDMLKHETGKRTEEYVELKRLEYAVRLLGRGGRSAETVAAELGLPVCRTFCALLEKLCCAAPEDSVCGCGPHPSS